MSTDPKWEAQILRAILFPQRALPAATDIYGALTGGTPDGQEDRPKEGTRRQFGTLEDGTQLQVVTSPIRIEIAKHTTQKAEEFLGGFRPTMGGAFDDQLIAFSQMIQRWLPDTSELAALRIAISGTALAEADTGESVYEILKKNLRSVEVEPAKMHDLLYRVNWRAQTTRVTEGYFNRLTTWSAIRIRLRATTTTDGPEVLLEDRHFAQLEFDVNTPAERAEPLPSSELAPIFADMTSLALENARSGERP